MTPDQSIDWCTGCETPPSKRIDLPEDWKDGDPIPDGLTIHRTSREGYSFAFRGSPLRHDRVRLNP